LVEQEGLAWDAPSPAHDSKTVAEELLTPTRIYVKSVLQALCANAPIKGLVHITGGGFQENLPRVLPDDLGAHIDLDAWNLPAVFQWLQSTGNIQPNEMLRTFNCGIGMTLIVSPDGLADVMAILAAEGETVIPIGTITPRDGDAVSFSGKLG
jgi:phosphoribosylformylglycinamidine cyclo-ligase